MTDQEERRFQVCDRVYDPSEGRTAIVTDIERQATDTVYVLRPDLPYPGSDFWFWRRTADDIEPAPKPPTPGCRVMADAPTAPAHGDRSSTKVAPATIPQ